MSPLGLAAAADAALQLDVIYRQTGLEQQKYPAAHLRPRPGLYGVRNRPVFQVGTWNDEPDPWTHERVDVMVQNFPEVVQFLHTWITINHEKPHQLARRAEEFDAVQLEQDVQGGLKAFFGFVSDLRWNAIPYVTSDGRTIAPGELVLSDWVNVAPKLALALERGNFLRASVGILDDIEINGTVYAHALQHISCEGEWEAVHTLDDLNRWYFGRSSRARVEPAVATFARPAGASRLYTFSQGGIAMPFPAGAKSPPAAAATPPAAPGDGATPEQRLTNLEKGVASLVQGMQQLNASVQQIAKNAAADAPPAAAMGADTPPPEEQPLVTDEPETPAAAVTPAAPGTTVAINFERELESRMKVYRAQVRQEVTTQVQAQLQAQQVQIDQIRQTETDRVKTYRSQERASFIKAARGIPSMLVPLFAFALEEAESLESLVPATKVRTFARLEKGAKVEDMTLSRVLRTFASNLPAAPTGPPDTVELQPPGSDVITAGKWNSASCHAEVKRIQAEAEKAGAPLLYSAANTKAVQLHGPSFKKGALTRAPETNN